MATIIVGAGEVRVALTRFERAMALRGDYTFTTALVTGVAVVDDPVHHLRGLRAPGLGWPGRVAIGRWRHRAGSDLVVVRKGERAVCIDLAVGARYRRVLVGVADPDELVRRLA